MVVNNSKKEKVELGQRGTPLWSFKRLKEGLITSLFDDLKNLEKDGLEEPECKVIRELLSELVARLAENSSDKSSPFLTEVWELFEDIRLEYIAWNDSETPDERKEKLKKMRELRNQISNRTRPAYREVDDNVNKPYIEKIFQQANETIASNYSVKFEKLTAAVYTFQKINEKYSLSGS